MFNKKIILIFTIFIVSLLAVSIVSAADNATSDVVSVEGTTDCVVGAVDNQVISYENENPKSVEKTTGMGMVDNQIISQENENDTNDIGNFSELSNLIGNSSKGDILELNKNYFYDSNSSRLIVINKAITINGNNHEINANKLSMIFTVSAKNVVLKNIKFINGFVGGGNGGAIRIMSDYVTLINCSFINNTASSDGALYIQGSNNNVINCSFINNKAYNYGGAIGISIIEKKNNIINCTFIENNAKSYKAINCHGDSTNIINCIFVNNDVTMFGNKGNIINCTFINHTGASIVVFTDNSYGGNLFNCSFINNSVSSYMIKGYTKFSLSNCFFIDNSASTIAYLAGEESVVTNCTFVGNFGTGIYLANDNSVVTNCTFINNSANDGGAIIAYGDNSILTNCVFVNNYAYNTAGAVYLKSSNCLLLNCSFINNSASEFAGALYLSYSNNNLKNCTFINNSASDGGAIFVSGDVNCLVNCIFSENNASRYGGAIYLINNGNILENCSFNSNSADYGSGIFIQGENNVLNCNTFMDNSAFTWGGAICWMGTEGILTNSSFTNNTATNGGAIFWTGDNGTLFNCSFLDNSAYENGSSTYWYGNNGNLTNCIVIDNNNLNQIYWWNKLNGNIENCKFINNTNGVINKGAKFSRNNISLYYSNASFDFKNPKTISVTLENVLDEFLINSTIAFNFVKNNILEEFNVNLSDNFASVCNELSDLEAGTWTVTAIFAGDDNYAPCNSTFTVTVNPIVCSLTIQVNDTEVEKETSIIVNVYDNINSRINEGSVVFFDGEKNIGESNVTDGVATLIYTPLTAGEHLIIARYYANDYINNSISTNLNVEKIDSKIIISNIIFDYDSVGSADFSINGAIGVNASIIDNNKAIVTIDENNIFVSSLDAGNYSLFVTTVPDANHNAVNAIANVTVNKIDSSISVEDMVFVYGGIGSSDVVLTGANSFIANVNSENAIVSIDGNVVTVSNLTGGSYVLEVTTIPDANHIAISKQANIVVNPINANLTANVSNIEFGSNAIVYIEINKEITGNVLIDGKEIIITNGKGIYTFINPNTGIHNVYIVFEGDNNFIADEKTVSFEVTKKSVPDNQNPFTPAKTDDEKQPNNPSYTIALNEDATGILTVTIGDKTFSKELVNGKATVEVDGVPAGDYVAIITYSGDDNYDSISRTVNATVKVDPEITASNAKVTYATGKYYTIKVNGTDGKLVNGITVNITGQISKTLTTTDGVAKFKVTQKPGTYNLNITALGKSVTKTLTVKHLVTLKSVTVKKSAKKLVLQATLGKVKGKYLKGKTITFKFNGKTYKAKTDKKGVAKLTIKSTVLKKLKVGKKVTYQSTYLKDTVKKTTKIKK